MSRSGYSDDCDGWDLIRWRGAVTSAIRGERGQKLLRELLAALDAMPAKELVAGEFHNEVEGGYCALGVVGAARGMDLSKLDVEDRESAAGAFGIATALAAEIMYVNDNCGWARWDQRFDSARLEREKRWFDVRAWVAEQIKATGATT